MTQIKKGKFKLLIFTFPFICVSIFIYANFKEPYNYLAKSKIEKMVQAYSDKSVGGDSEIQDNSTNQYLSYTYSVGTKKEYPYAGIMVYNSDSSYIDLSNYTNCEVTIKASKGQNIPFYITSYIENFSDWNEVMTFYCSLFTLNVKPEWQKIDIDLHDFAAPNWWYKNINKTKSDFNSPDLSKVSILNFANSIVLKNGESDTIEISSIIFYRHMGIYYLSSILFLILYFSLFYFRTYKYKQTPKPLFTYNKIEIVNHASKDLKTIFEYINSNYQNPELSIIHVQENTGINERKISALIKSETELNFKQFLNNLRIVEAKRLLLESNLHISEIAFKTGYGNISHFNRVFKSIENISPGTFRKQD